MTLHVGISELTLNPGGFVLNWGTMQKYASINIEKNQVCE